MVYILLTKRPFSFHLTEPIFDLHWRTFLFILGFRKQLQFFNAISFQRTETILLQLLVRFRKYLIKQWLCDRNMKYRISISWTTSLYTSSHTSVELLFKHNAVGIEWKRKCSLAPRDGHTLKTIIIKMFKCLLSVSSDILMVKQ